MFNVYLYLLNIINCIFIWEFNCRKRKYRIMKTKYNKNGTVTLADMHMNGVYFDPKILAAIRAKKTLPAPMGK